MNPEPKSAAEAIQPLYDGKERIERKDSRKKRKKRKPREKGKTNSVGKWGRAEAGAQKQTGNSRKASIGTE